MPEPMHEPLSPPPPPAYIPPAPSTSGLSDHLAAALAYVTIVPAIVFLVLEPYNRIALVRFHSFQSIGLCVAAFALQIALVVSETFLHFIPGSWILFAAAHALLGLGLLVAWIVVILKAYNGAWYKLPVIGDFAEKQARG